MKRARFAAVTEQAQAVRRFSKALGSSDSRGGCLRGASMLLAATKMPAVARMTRYVEWHRSMDCR